MLKCTCGSEEFITFRVIKVPVKINSSYQIIDEYPSKIQNTEPKICQLDFNEKFICAKCHKSGTYSTFNMIDYKDFCKKK